MPRSLSIAMLQALLAQETGQEWVYLLTIEHESLEAPIYVCDAAGEVVSNGRTFQAYGFHLALPEDNGEGFGTVKITIDNVDQWLTETIRSISGEALVTIEIVMLSDPDTIESGTRPMYLVDVSYDAMAVNGTLSYEPFFSEGFPCDEQSPSKYPGLF